jgi:hypothetical protein
MQQQTYHKKGKESPAFLEPQMMKRTQILLSRPEVGKYIVKAMCHYSDKEMLVVPFNMVNHWLFLSISTTRMGRSGTVTLLGRHIQIPATELPVISVMSHPFLTNKFLLHFSL